MKEEIELPEEIIIPKTKLEIEDLGEYVLATNDSPMFGAPSEEVQKVIETNAKLAETGFDIKIDNPLGLASNEESIAHIASQEVIKDFEPETFQTFKPKDEAQIWKDRYFFYFSCIKYISQGSNMKDADVQIAQYVLYELDLMTNLGTGFILTANTKEDVLYQLEGESFNVKYYNLNGPNGQLEIRNKKQLLEWFDEESS